jgi:hypothetical protein
MKRSIGAYRLGIPLQYTPRKGCNIPPCTATKPVRLVTTAVSPGCRRERRRRQLAVVFAINGEQVAQCGRAVGQVRERSLELCLLPSHRSRVSLRISVMMPTRFGA